MPSRASSRQCRDISVAAAGVMSAPEHQGVLIVGAGQAGASAASTLRKLGFSGPVTIASAEGLLPYERPPLSKGYLEGSKAFERLLIRPASFWSDRQISFQMNKRVVAVDAEARMARLHDGTLLGFDRLIWAAGGEARRLSCEGADLGRVFTIRSAADADSIRQCLPTTKQIVIVGGGFVGLEAAGVLSKLGKNVILIEAASRIMGRVAGSTTSAYFEQLHRSRGVSIRTNAQLDSIRGKDGVVQRVILATGEEIPADLIIVGIGMVPSTIPGQAAAGEVPGIPVNAHCQTSYAGILAAGDCTVQTNRFTAGAAIRIESVQNANDQGAVAAANSIGQGLQYDAVPWFWSHQHDAKFQSAGMAVGADREIVIGDVTSGKFAVAYIRGDEVAAVDSINSPGVFVRSRKTILTKFTSSAALATALS